MTTNRMSGAWVVGEDPDPWHLDPDDDDFINDAEGRHIYVPQVAAKWRPYFKYVAAVKNKCWIENDHRDTHAVRIGRELEDLWIEVDPNPGQGGGGRSDGRGNGHVYRYKSVREATLMLTQLARIDRRSWLGVLGRHAKLQFPKYMDLRFSPHLPAKFLYFVQPDAEPQVYSWEHQCHLLGTNDLSAGFLNDYSELCRFAMADVQPDKKEALIKALNEPVQVKLVVAPQDTTLEKQVALLQNLTHTVQQVQAAEAERATKTLAQEDGSFLPPAIRIEAIELKLGELVIHPQVLHLLQHLLETGVHVQFLSLPQQMPTDDCGSVEMWLAWSSFVTTALGVQCATDQPQVQVDSMALGQIHTIPSFLGAFCSALCKTKVLKVIKFNLEQTKGDEYNHRLTWAWLAYALFSKASNNSVKTVEFEALQLADDALDVLATIINADDPLEVLWREVSRSTRVSTTLDSMSNSRSIVRIPEGAPIIIIDGTCARPVVDTEAHLGTVICDDEDTAPIGVLIPGFGLCVLDRATVTAAGESPGDVEVIQPITTLVFGAMIQGLGALLGLGNLLGPATSLRAAPFLEAFLELVGAPLTALAIEAADLNDKHVAHALRLCPKLEALRIRHAKLASLDTITNHYVEYPRSKLMSLELGDLTIEIGQFHKFLRLLGSPSKDLHPMVPRLHRLRVGQGWSKLFTKKTEEEMESMLCTNQWLTYFHMYHRTGAHYTRWDPDEGGCNGDLVAGDPLPLDRRAAFISAVKHHNQHTTSAVGHLTPELMTQIFDLSLSYTFRRAYGEPDVSGFSLF